MSRHPRADDNTEGGILQRWARRKSTAGRPEPAGEAGEAARDQQEPGDAIAGQKATPGQDDPAARAEPEPVKTDADMPDLDSIDESTDMSDFFSPGVSEALRNQALRRLFRMAKFNVTDGLDDYAEDFRNFAPLGDIVTSDMRHRMEMDQKRQEELEELARGEEAPVSGDAEAEVAVNGEKDATAPTESTSEAEDEDPLSENRATETNQDDEDTEQRTRSRT